MSAFNALLESAGVAELTAETLPTVLTELFALARVAEEVEAVSDESRRDMQIYL